jgi:homoserine kinase
MPQRVRAFAPATSANVSCGFDVFGFALEAPGDEVELRISGPASAEAEIRMITVEGDGGALPRDGMRNTATVATLALLAAYVERQGTAPTLDLFLKKGLPKGSGMGSSAASAAAAVIAANRLLGEPFTVEELVRFAMEGERAACGAAHADNVAPAVLGGFVLVRSYTPLDLIRLNVPDELWAAIVHPDLVLSTAKARAILPIEYPRSVLVDQVGNAAALVAGLLSSDYELIGRSLRDSVAEPYRAPLIAGFAEVKAAAMEAGALGAGISGSGPSTFALTRGADVARRVADAVIDAFTRRGIAAQAWTGSVASGGPRILLEE